VVRPPYGWYDAEVLAAAQSLGLQVLLWDVDSRDWQLTDPEEIVARVVQAVRPGSIVRFHADDSYPVVPQLIPQLVRELHRRGFMLLPLRVGLEQTQ